MTNWYRKKTWTKNDEEEFFMKLNKAKKESRAQYLKVQAIELVETKNTRLLDVAETLLNKLLLEYPDNNIEKSPSLNTIGDIYKYRGNYDLAIDYYKKAIDFEEIFPNVLTQAYLEFSELALKLKKENYYAFAEQIMSKRIEHILFPLEKYKAFSILSILNQLKGNVEKAEQFGLLAEQNANAKTSGLKYHKDLGIVKERNNWLDKIVNRKKTDG